MSALMGPLPAIFVQMDKEGVSGALKQSPEFTNACALSCSVQAIEALRRFTNLTPKSKESLAQFAATLLPQINRTVGRLKNGLNFKETIYLFNLLLRDENLYDDFQLQIEKLENVHDLNLKTNELAFLPVQVASTGEGHMLLVYSATDGHLLVFDPNIGGTVALKLDSEFRLGNYKSLSTMIRLSPRHITTMSTLDQGVDHLIQDLITLKEVIQLGPLPIGKPGQLTLVEAKAMIDRLLTSLNDGQPALTADLAHTAPGPAASVLEIRHRVLEVQALANEHDFFNYLRRSGLSSTANLNLNIAGFDLAQLDSTIYALEQIVTKTSLNFDDLQVLRMAIQKYTETASQMAKELPPEKVHNRLTPFYEKIKQVYDLPQTQARLKIVDFVSEFIILDWTRLTSARDHD